MKKVNKIRETPRIEARNIANAPNKLKRGEPYGSPL